MLNKVNLADIRAFVLIAQLGNFTKAAEAMSVSRSHVSRQISALESQLGVTLLTRTTRSLKLTYAGQRFHQQCEGALAQVEQALYAAVDDTEEVQGLIRVNSVGGHLGEDVVAEYIADFMQIYPNVSVDLDFSSPRIDLIEDQFDIAFRMGNLEDAGFIGKHLTDIEMVTLASPGYIERYGLPTHPKDLLEHQVLRGSVTRWSYQSSTNSEETFSVNVHARLACRNGRALVSGALKGNGIIRVPLMYCRDEVQSGDLVSVLPNWAIPTVPFYAVYHRDKFQPKRLRTFIDYMKQKFEQ